MPKPTHEQYHNAIGRLHAGSNQGALGVLQQHRKHSWQIKDRLSESNHPSPKSIHPVENFGIDLGQRSPQLAKFPDLDRYQVSLHQIKSHWRP